MAKKEKNAAKGKKDNKNDKCHTEIKKNDTQKISSVESNILSYAEKFPDVRNVFKDNRREIGEVVKDCLVVIDANVLLWPYDFIKKHLDDLEKIYRSLAKTNRIFIPEHAAREFVANRAQKLSDINHELTGKSSNVPTVKDCPVLNDVNEYKDLVKIREKLEKIRKEFDGKKIQLAKRIKKWTWKDPVVAMYDSVFSDERFFSHQLKDQELVNDYKRRCKYRIAPGYKDEGKEENAAGDIIIWQTILELGKSEKDLVFVSGDVKNDWWNQSSGSHFVPKFELLDEYSRASNNHNIYLIQFSDFLELFGGDDATVEEVRKKEDNQISFYQETKKLLLRDALRVSGTFHDDTYCSCGYKPDSKDRLEVLSRFSIRDGQMRKDIVALCPNCHRELHAAPSMATGVCPTCKLTVPDEDANFCANCGQKL